MTQFLQLLSCCQASLTDLGWVTLVQQAALQLSLYSSPLSTTTSCHRHLTTTTRRGRRGRRGRRRVLGGRRRRIKRVGEKVWEEEETEGGGGGLVGEKVRREVWEGEEVGRLEERSVPGCKWQCMLGWRVEPSVMSTGKLSLLQPGLSLLLYISVLTDRKCWITCLGSRLFARARRGGGGRLGVSISWILIIEALLISQLGQRRDSVRVSQSATRI